MFNCRYPVVSLNPIYPCFSSGSPTYRCHWPHYDSRPCGCQKTSRSLSLHFRLMWILTQARRCSPACCCLNSHVNHKIKVMFLIETEDVSQTFWITPRLYYQEPWLYLSQDMCVSLHVYVYTSKQISVSMFLESRASSRVKWLGGNTATFE